MGLPMLVLCVFTLASGPARCCMNARSGVEQTDQTEVPEPGTLGMVAVGTALLLLRRIK